MVRVRMLFAVAVVLAAFGAGAVAHGTQAGERQLEADGALDRLSLNGADASVYGVQAREVQWGAAPAAALQPWNLHASGLMPAVGAGGALARLDALAADPFRTVTPFTAALQTALGPVTASGFAVRTATPRLLSGMLRSDDRQQYDLQDFAVSAALMPGVDLNLGYNLDMAGRFDSYDAAGSAAYDGLFFSASAVNAPYASLSNGSNFVGATIALASDLHLRFAVASLNPHQVDFAVPSASLLVQLQGAPRNSEQRKAQSTIAGIMWDFAKWGGLGVTAARTDEQNGILGNAGANAVSLPGAASTDSIGLSARFGFGSGWVTTFSYNEGITQLDLRPNGVLGSTDTLHSRAYGLAIAKHGLFSGNDSVGLALSRPLQVYAGGADLAPSTARNVLIGGDHLLLPSNTPETDVELGYVTTFLDGALALQANAGYQMNLAGQKGQNSVTVLSRAKINF